NARCDPLRMIMNQYIVKRPNYVHMKHKVRMRSEKDDIHLTLQIPQLSRRCDAVHPFHLNIQKKELTICLLQSGDQRLPAVKFSDMIVDPAQLQLRGQDSLKVAAKDFLVIADCKLQHDVFLPPTSRNFPGSPS